MLDRGGYGIRILPVESRQGEHHENTHRHNCCKCRYARFGSNRRSGAGHLYRRVRVNQYSHIPGPRILRFGHQARYKPMGRKGGHKRLLPKGHEWLLPQRHKRLLPKTPKERKDQAVAGRPSLSTPSLHRNQAVRTVLESATPCHSSFTSRERSIIATTS
jgi:hypothetical protein